MPLRRAHVAASAAQSELAQSLIELRESLEAPTEFSDAALEEASSFTPPEPELDLRDVAFATLDPEGSQDLDQAFHLARRGSGYEVRYAIADVPSFVPPGGPLDAAARERGQTLYAADGNIPLHPPVLSEDRASLLPGVDRPALVWTFALAADGSLTSSRLQRAWVRSRAKLSYAQTQAALDAGEETPAALLPEIGRVLHEQEAARGGASLNVPDEEVVRSENGAYDIVRALPLDVEDWNAQLSLLTGMTAASIMIDAGIGILRTMPAPDAEAFAAFRHQTRTLGRGWTGNDYGAYLRSLDHEDPATLPILEAASSLFRGAGYVTFNGSVPDDTIQSAIAAPYAHTTAPLRRLVDRWSLAICLAVSEGREVPEWVTDSLEDVPGLMSASAQRAGRLNSGTIDRVEAALLSPHIGEAFETSVISVRADRGRIQLAEPPVTASAPLPDGTGPGDTVALTLVRAEIASGVVEFEL